MKAHLQTALAGYGSGFHFTVKPPPGVEQRRNLLSSDPEEVLACVLANLQLGHFDAAEALLPLVQREDDARVWAASSDLLGYGAPVKYVRSFFEFASKLEEVPRYQACATALCSGSVWAVSPTLQVHATLSDLNLRAILATDLSWLLEPSPGAIFHGPALITPDPDASPLLSESQPYQDDAGYADLVTQRADALRAGSAGGNVFFAEGEPIQILSIARRLLDRIRDPDASRARIEQGWVLFGAMSGIDCRDFFDREGHLRPLSAAAILEDFIQSGAAERFEPGVRYFFGRPIPT